MDDTQQIITDQPVVNIAPQQEQPVSIPQETPPAQAEPIQETLSTQTTAHVDNPEQPKQEAFPNLNAGATPGNNYNELWKTKEERIEACIEYCNYLRSGLDKRYYHHDYRKVIELHYMVKYPEDFVSEKIHQAERDGLQLLEKRLHAASVGKVPGAMPALLIFIAKNKLGWRDRSDITTNDKDLPSPIIGGTSVPTDISDE